MRILWQMCLWSAIVCPPCLAQIPAFPGAEGFGAISVGGRGGDVYHVTSLADTNTLGTLRHAINTAPSGGRTIVFDVSGNIYLNSDLSVNRPKITIAGQTAPGQGITLTGDSVWLESSDLVVRYIRSRLTSTGGTQDSLSIKNGNRVIMDHISASWSADETTSMTENSSNNSIQWSLITEALNSQNHSRASLFRPGSNVPSGSAPHEFNLSVHHSLYAHSSDRNPVFSTYNEKILNADFRNNVVFDWRNQASHTGSSDAYVNLNFVGNFYVAGLTTRADLVANPKIYSADGPRTVMYHNDNLVDSTRDDGLHNGIYLASSVGGGFVNAAIPFNYPTVTTQAAAEAYESVLNYAGAHWWNRDPVDERVTTDVREISDPDPNVRAMSGTMLTTEADAGGLPALPIETRPADWDVDGDGMPGWWELERGLDPFTKDHNGDFDSDLYTNLEEYINEVGAFPAPADLVFQGSLNNRFARSENWSNNWQPAQFDTAIIPSGIAIVDAVGQLVGTIQVAPQSGQTAALDISGGWLDVADSLEIASLGADGAVNLSGGKLSTKTLLKGTGGTFNFTGGTLSAETVGFDLENNGGTLAPGDSPGLTMISGNYTQNSGSLAIEIGGTDPGVTFDRVEVAGFADLMGTLDVTLVNGFTPTLGDNFGFLFASSGFNTDFSSIDLPDISHLGLDWQLNPGGSTLFLEVVAGGLPGDFDNDGDVDGRDFLLWQRNPTIGALADWQANYDTGNLQANSFAVPEPTTGVTAIIVSALIAIACRRNGTSSLS